jgi:predicted patatin/cPLA2 family phospholipase
MGGIAQAIDSFNREFRQRSLSEDQHTNRLRSALQDLTHSMETLVTDLPDPAITGSGWNEILLDLESLTEKQRRIEEIQKAFEATMKEVEDGLDSIRRHIQESVRQERESIETLQKRIQMAEGLSRLLTR